jgi:hypothetical protein
MASAGETVYDGRIGTGAAQIIRKEMSPFLAASMAQDNARANREIQQQKADQTALKDRNAQVEKYVNENIGKPGWFQQEKSVNEYNAWRGMTKDYSYKNPHLDYNTVANDTEMARGIVSGRIAKRNEAQEETETLRAMVNKPTSKYDSDWANAQANSYYDKDIDHVQRGEIINIANHPRAYDAQKGIISSVKDVTNQYQSSTTGQPTETAFGIQIEGVNKKVRFKTDAKGNIANETVDYVLDSDPGIDQRIRWDIARDMAGVSDDTHATPAQMQKIQGVYDKIKNSDDDSIVSQVRGKVRDTLSILQRVENKNTRKIQKSSAGSSKVTPVDLDDRKQTINNISNPFDGEGKITPQAQESLNRLKTGKTLGGRPILSVEVQQGTGDKVPLTSEQMADMQNAIFNGKGKEWMSKHKNAKFPTNPGATSNNAIILNIKVGTDPDSFSGKDKLLSEPISINLSDPASRPLINAIFNTSPAEKKIMYQDIKDNNSTQFLDTEEESSDDGGYLDE